MQTSEKLPDDHPGLIPTSADLSTAIAEVIADHARRFSSRQVDATKALEALADVSADFLAAIPDDLGRFVQTWGHCHEIGRKLSERVTVGLPPEIPQ